MVEPTDVDLIDILTESQRLGFLGARPVPDAIDHARAFVRALDQLLPGTHVLDLGSGGGLPGLVIANDRPDLVVHLLDRRMKRTDFLERVVRRLDWVDRVTVLAVDAEHHLATNPARVDAVVARGFGPPEQTLRIGVQLVRPAGLVVISEPPAGDRWDPDVIDHVGVVRLPATGADRTVAVFQRVD